MFRLNTTSDLMKAVAEALETGDMDMLEECWMQVEDWCQTEEERNAQLALIRAAKMMVDAAFDYSGAA